MGNALMIAIELSPLELDPLCGLSRSPPRLKEFRQPGYEEEFDRETIFYDLFWSADGSMIVGIGPPLANLEKDIAPVLTRTFGCFDYRPLDRISQLWFRGNLSPSALPVSLFRQSQLDVQPNHHALFDGKKVALVKSRDNALNWIQDWAAFSASNHGCDAILFYDNGSNGYTTAEIEKTLISVPGITTAVVVAWPYKFGPSGGKHFIWDSDFCKYGILEHARHRFLARAHSVLQTDIDELVLTEGRTSVFDLVSASATGHIRFDGHWIENATTGLSNPADRRHRDFFYRDKLRWNRRTQPKWAVVPRRCPQSAQWCVHWISNMKPDPIASTRAELRHFKAINTNWSYERWRIESVDLDRHVIDEELAHCMGVLRSLDSEG
jgi:hypothetical protein